MKGKTRDHFQPSNNGRQKEGVSRGGHRGRPQLRHTVGCVSRDTKGDHRDTKGDHRHPQGERGVSGGTEGDQYHHPRQTNPWKLKLLRYQRHISNLVKKSCQSEAVQVLEQMKRSKVRPDVVVYNTILSGYGKQGDVNSAFKTFNEVCWVCGSHDVLGVWQSHNVLGGWQSHDVLGGWQSHNVLGGWQSHDVLGVWQSHGDTVADEEESLARY